MKKSKTDIYSITQLTEDEARAHLEAIRWPDGAVCPHCDSKDSYELSGETTRRGLRKCAGCRKPFSVTMGTPLESSHIPLAKWVLAVYLMIESKKGMSAKQLQRMIGGSYKTSWFMCHRIREMMGSTGPDGGMTGAVEVDETYVGGKPKKGSKRVGQRGTKGKTPVVAMVARDGETVARVVPNASIAAIEPVVQAHVSPDAVLMTDELYAYKRIGREFAGHEAVHHTNGEFARGNAHTNTVEAYFSLLKRGIYGTFHQVSAKHLGRYADEFAFRFSRRKDTVDAQMRDAFFGGTGKRLTYKKLVA